MSKENGVRKNYIELIITAIASVCMGLIAYYILYHQSFGGEKFYSDIPAHIEMGANKEGYSLVDLLLGLFAQSKYVNVLTGLLGAIVLFLSMFTVIRFLRKEVNVNILLSLIFAGFIILLTPLYIPYFSPYFDLSGFVLQPWHSITYLAMRAAAIGVVVITYRIINSYRENINSAEWISLTVCLALCTWIKPSFLTIYSITLLCFLIFDWVKAKFSVKIFRRAFCLGLAVIPSVLIAVWQAVILFDGTAESGIAFSLYGSPLFKNGGTAFCLQLLTGLLLPTIVYIYNLKRLKRFDVFIILMFVIAFAQILFFSESGVRANDNNFYWSVYVASFFLYFDVILIFIRPLSNCKRNRVLYGCYLLICIVIMIWHLLSGGLFLYKTLLGYSYGYWPWIIEPYFPGMKGILYH